MPKPTMEIRRDLPHFGDTDIQTGHIRLNPAKGDFVNTVIHEKLHRSFPEMSEQEVQMKAAELEATLTPRKISQMMLEVEEETGKGSFIPQVHTVASKTKSSDERGGGRYG